MSAIINGIDNDGVKSGEGNGGNGEASVGAASLNVTTIANEVSTLSMKLAMNKIESGADIKEDNANGKDDEITTESFHDMGKLTLESIAKRYKLYELLVKDHPTSKGKNASTSERLAKNDQRSTLVYGEISFNSFAVAMEKVINKYGGLQESGGIFYDIGSGTGNRPWRLRCCMILTKSMVLKF